ncbi:MAG TPA: endonuclease/exonuclease/phosphatase family protein [Blastocatellia bacterium]|nr:endonuclease/exonuclease/phosphatase family protein [Blastocatellia bacterium]
MTLKLLSYNIRYGGVRREQYLGAVIRSCDPDVVVFQEATRPAVVERLAGDTGMPVWAARAGHSLAFMSRLPVAHYDWHRPPGARHPYLEVVPAGTGLRVFGLHLSAVHSNWTEWRRIRELRALLKDIEQHQNGYHAIVGDFNTLAPGAVLDTRRLPLRLRPLIWLSGGKIQWRVIQIMLDAHYADGYRSLHPADAGFTFPTWDANIRLDYVFLPQAFAGRLTGCEVITDGQVAQASDHFPLLARLEVL